MGKKKKQERPPDRQLIGLVDPSGKTEDQIVAEMMANMNAYKAKQTGKDGPAKPRKH